MPLLLLLFVVLANLFTAPPRVAKMPGGHPRVAHFTGPGPFGYIASDSLASIGRAIRLLYGWIDINAQVDADGVVWAIHWGVVRKSGWKWVWNGRYDAKGREVRVKNASPNREIQHMKTAEVQRLRSKQYGGLRPRTMRDHMVKVVHSQRRKPLTICMEMKANHNWSQAVLDRVYSDAIETNCYVVVMTLQDLPGWRDRLTFALDASHGSDVRGFQCALLPRGPRPDDWSAWADRGVKKWGAWRKKMS